MPQRIQTLTVLDAFEQWMKMAKLEATNLPNPTIHYKHSERDRCCLEYGCTLSICLPCCCYSSIIGLLCCGGGRDFTRCCDACVSIPISAARERIEPQADLSQCLHQVPNAANKIWDILYPVVQEMNTQSVIVNKFHCLVWLRKQAETFKLVEDAHTLGIQNIEKTLENALFT